MFLSGDVYKNSSGAESYQAAHQAFLNIFSIYKEDLTQVVIS